MLLTNANIYLAIAEEALAESQRLDAQSKTLKQGGEPGFIIKFDPEQKSHKQALIAIIFAANYLEAIFYQAGIQKFGEQHYKDKIDRETYEQKLKIFGITDSVLIDAAKKFRETRRVLVHEKAKNISEISPEDWRYSQPESAEAVSFVKLVTRIILQTCSASLK